MKIVLPIKDNWVTTPEKFPYATTRYLDALASIFAVQSPCAAIVVDNNKKIIKLAYNADATAHNQKRIQEIKDCLKKIGTDAGAPDLLIGLYLCFNVDFRGDLERYVDYFLPSTSDPELKNLIKKLCKKISDFKTITGKEKLLREKGKLIDEEEINVIVKEYYYVLKELTKELVVIPPELLLRPLQDAKKIAIVAVHDDILRYKVELVPSGMHAEITVTTEAEVDYVGVSKLSCYACHDKLDKDGILHRGTHGLLFPDSKIYQDIDGELIQPSDLRSIQQHRKMSVDEKFEDDKFLAELKKVYKGAISTDETSNSNGKAEKVISGKGLAIYNKVSYWYQYSKNAMEQMLKLRIESTELSENTSIIVPNYFWNQSIVTTEKLAVDITAAFKLDNKMSLVVLNLYAKHWVGIIIEKSEDDNVVKLNYMDPQSKILCQMLLKKAY